MNRLCYTLFAALLLAVLPACSSTETGNPGSGSKLTFQTKSVSPGSVMVGDATSELDVGAVWLSLNSVTLSPCDGGAPGALLGDWVVDATANPTTAVVVPAGSYCGLELVVGPAPSLPASAPAALQGQSALVVGKRRDGVVFRVQSSATTSIALGNNGYPLVLPHSALLVVDVAMLLGNVGIAGFTPNAANEVDIEITHYRDPTQKFEANLAKAITLHDDVNGNLRLDPNELQPIAYP